GMRRMESAFDLSLGLNEVHASASPESLEGLLTEVLDDERVADQSPGCLRDDELARSRARLEPGCEIGRLARHRTFLANRASNEVPNNDAPRGYADPGLELDIVRLQQLHSTQRLEPGSDRAFRVIFVGGWPAEIRHDAVPHESGDVATIAGDRAGDPILIA